MLSPSDYEYLAHFLEEHSGLELGSDKAYLVESRLQPVAEQAGLGSISNLVQTLRMSDDFCLKRSVVDAMTTNESLFFRDSTPFELLKLSILPSLIEKRQQEGRVRIWSAGCSTGQEPYSIAMTLADIESDFRSMAFDLIASDLCEAALKKAEEGVYSTFETQRGLSQETLSKYFTAHPQGWKVNDSIRRRVAFHRQNLMAPFYEFGNFDVIFCRYVLIYFSAQNKKIVLDRLSEVLRPDGFLILGGPETTLGASEAFAKVDDYPVAIYRKKEKVL